MVFRPFCDICNLQNEITLYCTAYLQSGSLHHLLLCIINPVLVLVTFVYYEKHNIAQKPNFLKTSVSWDRSLFSSGPEFQDGRNLVAVWTSLTSLLISQLTNDRTWIVILLMQSPPLYVVLSHYFAHILLVYSSDLPWCCPLTSSLLCGRFFRCFSVSNSEFLSVFFVLPHSNQMFSPSQLLIFLPCCQYITSYISLLFHSL